VVASGNGASFNANQVVGPKVHIIATVRRELGRDHQRRRFDTHPIDATFEGGQFVGANIRLSINREGGQTTVVGSVLDRIVRIEVTATRSGSGPARVLKFREARRTGGVRRRSVHEARGRGQQAPPTPAFALADRAFI
jgi:hypothetical protein